MTHHGRRGQHCPRNSEKPHERRHHGACARPVGIPGTSERWIPGWQSQSPEILTRYGQNRGQKTGSPAKRRKGDEIVLLSRGIALRAAESSSKAKSPNKRQPGMKIEPWPHLRHSTSHLPCNSQITSSASITQDGKISAEPTERLFRGKKDGDACGGTPYLKKKPYAQHHHPPLGLANFPRSKGMALRKVETLDGQTWPL